MSAPDRADLVDAFVAHLEATGRQYDGRYCNTAERFLARWPEPQAWAAEPLEVRLGADPRTRQLLVFLMLHRHLRPGHDYLLERTFISLWRELAVSPLDGDMQQYLAAARELGFVPKVARCQAGLVPARLLIQSGRPLGELRAADLDDFEHALEQREARSGRRSRHYRAALFATRSVLFHLGILAEAPAQKPGRAAEGFERRLTRTKVPAWLRPTILAYLERLAATHSHSTVNGTATKLGQFGRHLAEVDPGLGSLARLERAATSRPTSPPSPGPGGRSTAPRSLSRSAAAASSRSTAFSTTSANGAGPKRRPTGCSSLATSRGARRRCRATCPSTRTVA